MCIRDSSRAARDLHKARPGLLHDPLLEAIGHAIELLLAPAPPALQRSLNGLAVDHPPPGVSTRSSGLEEAIFGGGAAELGRWSRHVTSARTRAPARVLCGQHAHSARSHAC
eukprot:9043977-Alexandrium_andersonii.AAC.1